METVTLEIPDRVFKEFQDLAKQMHREPAELIREAMEIYRLQRIQPLLATEEKKHSVLDHQPISAGEVLKPWTSRAELLEGFFDRD
jgi:hypothetical protein